MAISDKSKVIKRSDKTSPLTQTEVDNNFQEVRNVIDDATNNESDITTLDSKVNTEVQRLDNRVDSLVYDSVAVMSADSTLEVGDKVRTLGYYAPGDGGGNDYEIVAAATGTADGGSFIDLDNGLQAKGLFGSEAFPEQFGANGGGVVDDTPAFNNWLGYIQGGLVLGRIGRGTFRLSGALSVSNAGLKISGDGIGRTTLLWGESTTSGAGLSITTNDDKQHVSIQDITLLSEGVGTDTAIYINRSAEESGGVIQDRISPRVLISNVEARGEGISTVNGWDKGIDLIDCMHTTIRGFHFVGYRTTPTSMVSTAAIHAAGQFSPTELVISDTWAFISQNAVKVRGTYEGVHIRACNFVSVDRAVNWIADVSDPLLILTDSHVASFDTNVLLQNVNQSIISNNLFYKRSDSVLDSAGVYLNNCKLTNVSGNTFTNTSTTYDYNCVQLEGSSDLCSVNNNIFQTGTTGIWFRSTTSGCRHSNNTFVTLTNNNVLDQSSSNRKHPGLKAEVSLTSRLSIPNSTAAVVSWGNERTDEIGGVDIAAAPSRITIPDGVDEVEISAGVVWAANSVGIRSIQLVKNGVDVIGLGKTFNNAVSNTSAFLIGRERVVAGDYLELKVYQDSGAALDLLVDSGTFLKAIVVESAP